MSYTVQAGDTLSAIARKFGVTVADIQAWSGLTTTLIKIGQKLNVSDRIQDIATRLDRIDERLTAVEDSLVRLGQAINCTIQLGRQSSGPATPSVEPTEESPAFATLTFINTSNTTATTTEGYVTFGMAFKKGDVASTKTPKLRRADNDVEIPAQFDLRNVWSDDSLRWCEVSCIAPSIAAGQELAVEVYAATASYDNTAARVLSDITGSTDLKIALTNLTDFNFSTYATGSSTADFNTASAQGGIYLEKLKSGPICDQWKAWMMFPDQGGSTADQLAGMFYVTAWTKDSDGTLGPISHISKVHQGWLRQTPRTRYICEAALMDGAGTIRDLSPSFTFTLAGSNIVTTSSAHGMVTGQAVIVSNSGGALPTGLVANTIYYWINLTSTTGAFEANYASTTKKTISGGSGTHTVQSIINHPHHSAWFTCASDGLPDWTSDEATIVVAQDKSYLRSTGLIPPFDVTLTAAPHVETSPTSYVPSGYAGKFSTNIGGTGGSAMRGYLPEWDVNRFLSQDPGYMQTGRANALTMAHIPNQVLNEATGKVPTFAGPSTNGASGNYTGLGTTELTTDLDTLTSSSGGNGVWANFTDMSHWPNGCYYTALTEGGAHLI